MFLGEYSHTIDTKGRLFMPSKFREELKDTFFVTKSVDTCLAVYSSEEWTRFTDKINALPEIQSRKIRRFLFSAATEVSPDLQGRILLPSNLREYAKLEKAVTVVGVGDHIEIWSEESFKNELSSEDVSDIEQTLISLGF
ncbi:MAG: division/cell wall cluster transcriptional repressor MraZ [Clostridia bacterium]|nr:division/cell wall cluster transcriptional repressor MraZ [Clostridia bacterium]